MDTRRILGCIALGGLIMLPIGCGQRMPENYGIYIKEGTEWQSIDLNRTAQFISVGSAPEFLVFDRRLQGSVNAQNVAQLNVTKWTRKLIEIVVAGKDTPPVKYTSTPGRGFVTLSEQIPLVASPVKKHSDMLVVKPHTTLPPGFYNLTIFDVDYSLSCTVKPDAPDRYPTSVQVDKWYKTVSDKNGFSWDGWMAMTQKMPGEERTYNGRGVVDVSYKDILLYEKLLADLGESFALLAKSRDIAGLAFFCSRVREFDQDLYNTKVTETLAVAKQELKSRVASSDWPYILGNCQVLISNGISDTEIEEILANSKISLQNRENEDIAALKGIVEQKGKVVATHQFVDDRRTLSLEIMDGGLAFQQIRDNRVVDSWINMSGIAKVEKYEDGWRKLSGVSVISDYIYNHSGGGSDSEGFGFQNESTRDLVFDQISAALNEWTVQHQAVLVRSFDAPSDYWSQRIPVCGLAYKLAVAPGSSQVEVQSPGDGGYVVDSGDSYVSSHLRKGTEWIQIKARGSETVKVELTLCPANRGGWRYGH